MYYRNIKTVLVTCLILTCLILSCETKLDESNFPFQVENSELFKDQYKLKLVKRVILPLDETIGFFNRSLCFRNFSKHSILSVLNILNGSVYFFDYTNKKLLYKLKLEKEGPNGVGKLDALCGHLVISDDSVIILNYKTQKLFLLDGKGKVSKSFNLMNVNKKLIFAFASSVNRISRVGDNILLPCHTNNMTESDRGLSSFIKINIKTGNILEVFNYPDLYTKGAWLAPYKFMASYTNDRVKKRILISFPIDPYIYEANENGEYLNKYYISSKHFNKILPFSSENSMRFIKNIPKEKAEEYLATSSMFNNLIYLEKNKLFLREAYLASSIEKYNMNKDPYLNSSFIIFNEKFEKIGETVLPPKVYFTKISFVTDDELHLANESEYRKNENQLTFDVFKIAKK